MEGIHQEYADCDDATIVVVEGMRTVKGSTPSSDVSPIVSVTLERGIPGKYRCRQRCL